MHQSKHDKFVFGIEPTSQSNVMAIKKSNLIGKQIVASHLKNHYRKVYNAKSRIDNRPPSSMLNSQLSRETAKRKLLHQIAAADKIRHRIGDKESHVRIDPITSTILRNNIRSNSRNSFASYNDNLSSIRYEDSASQVKNYRGDRIQTARSHCSSRSISQLSSSTRSARPRYVNKRSGDLIEKHSDRFISTKPFHPRILSYADVKSKLKNNTNIYNDHKLTKKREKKNNIDNQLSVDTKYKNLIDLDDTYNSISHDMPPKSPMKSLLERSEITFTNQQSLSEQVSELRERTKENTKRTHDIQTKLQKSYGNLLTDDDNTKFDTESTIFQKELSVLENYAKKKEEKDRYRLFIQDITNEIVRENYTTEKCINNVCDKHLRLNQYNLIQERMELEINLFKIQWRRPSDYKSNLVTSKNSSRKESITSSTIGKENGINDSHSSQSFHQTNEFHSNNHSTRASTTILGENNDESSDNETPQHTLTGCHIDDESVRNSCHSSKTDFSEEEKTDSQKDEEEEKTDFWNTKTSDEW
ncbi:hypothetical protein SNEBB_006814 [Seison nebaliae]|nr:hypothetical protein SNEBB_006814 [Seison nebaliae]